MGERGYWLQVATSDKRWRVGPWEKEAENGSEITCSNETGSFYGIRDSPTAFAFTLIILCFFYD